MIQHAYRLPLTFQPISLKWVDLIGPRSACSLRGGQPGRRPGTHEFRGPTSQTRKKRGCTLSKANKIKCVLLWICEWQFRVMNIKFFIQK
jgi:hypothetical protein